MASNLDLYIDQGADFEAVLPPVTDTSGNVVNLTGYTVASQIRRSYASLYAIELTATIAEDPTTGVITLTLGNGATAGLSPLRYVYDVIITNTGTNFQTKVFDGLVVVNPGVTNKPNTIIVTPYIPDDFGGL